MDPKLLIGFISSHYVLIFGTTLAFFFATSMVLLIRSIGQKGGETVPIDVDAIEGVMKRVLASQPVSVSVAKLAPAASSAAAEGAPLVDVPGDSSAALAERDATIESLKQEIDALKAATPSADAGPVDGSATSTEIAALGAKVEELQARLAEYEIIEDDIADLSMFKEKNRTLETELAALKTKLAEAETNAASAPAAVAPAPVASVPAAETASLTPSLDSGIKFEKIEKFELNMDDDVMKEFTQAVEGNQAAIAAVKDLPPTTAPATTAASAPVDLGSQADVDALLKAHTGDEPVAAPSAPPAMPSTADTQSEIDALMKAHAAGEAIAPVPAPAAPAVASARGPAVPPTDPPVEIGEKMELKIVHEPGLDDLLMGDALAPEEPHVEAAAAIEDPLAGATDAEKMLSEVEHIASDTLETGADALEEALDTDKLLAEVDSLKNGIKSA